MGHEAVCEELYASCRAAEFGCEVKTKRKFLHSHESSCPLLKMSIKLAEVLLKLQNVEENFNSQVIQLKEQIAAREKEIKQLKSKVKVQKKTTSEQINRLGIKVVEIEKIGNQELEDTLIRAELIKRQQCEEMKNFRAYITIKEKDIIMGAYNANLYSVLENMAA
jgi:vacuolar-type H+-ATPase subunit I/STV1